MLHRIARRVRQRVERYNRVFTRAKELARQGTAPLQSMRRRQLGTNGQALVRARYSKEALVSVYEHTYADVAHARAWPSAVAA